MPWELSEVLDGDLVKEGWKELNTLPALRQEIRGVTDTQLKVGVLETTWYMRNQLLRDTDWASMAHSLEVRVPLVDVELFRCVARLSLNGYPPTKQNMVNSLTMKLPESVVQRPKTGFSIPVREWISLNQRNSAGRGLKGWLRYVYTQTPVFGH